MLPNSKLYAFHPISFLLNELQCMLEVTFWSVIRDANDQITPGKPRCVEYSANVNVSTSLTKSISSLSIWTGSKSHKHNDYNIPYGGGS